MANVKFSQFKLEASLSDNGYNRITISLIN